jgi:hypothetical protein
MIFVEKCETRYDFFRPHVSLSAAHTFSWSVRVIHTQSVYFPQDVGQSFTAFVYNNRNSFQVCSSILLTNYMELNTVLEATRC